MADHDQRLKVAVPEFLAEFADLVLPTGWAGRFVCPSADWLTQEIFLDPPKGERRLLDLVARVLVTQPTGDSSQTLLHVEIESGDNLTSLRGRMPGYHDGLRARHGGPVLSVALYLGVGLQGKGWDSVGEDFWEESLGSRRWPYLGLPALDALDFVESPNILGVGLCVLMRIPVGQEARLKARAMRRVAEASLTPMRRFLLMEMIEAYLPLVGPHLGEYQQLLLTEDFDMVRVMGQTTFEKGIEMGAVEGQRLLLRDMLEEKFDPLGEVARQRLAALPAERLRELGRALLRAGSLAELGLEDESNGTARTPG